MDEFSSRLGLRWISSSTSGSIVDEVFCMACFFQVWGSTCWHSRYEMGLERNKITVIDTPVQKRRRYGLNCVPTSIHILTVFEISLLKRDWGKFGPSAWALIHLLVQEVKDRSHMIVTVLQSSESSQAHAALSCSWNREWSLVRYQFCLTGMLPHGFWSTIWSCIPIPYKKLLHFQACLLEQTILGAQSFLHVELFLPLSVQVRYLL